MKKKSARYGSLCERIIANSVLMPLGESPVINGEPCWIWVGSRKLNNRGQPYPRMTIRVNGAPRGQRVHRLVIREFHRVKLDPKLVAGHKCNNTMCVNPAHLELVTQTENMNKCVAEGRHNSQIREPGED